MNVLGDHQEELCRGFAVSGGQQVRGRRLAPGAHTGSPVIDGSLAWVDCEVELVHDAGDHELIIGRVLDLGTGEGSPLLFFRSKFATACPAHPHDEG